MNILLRSVAYKFLFLCILSAYGTTTYAYQMIDTVDNYIELKLYSGTNDTVYVIHERYHCLFSLSDCDVENYGTTFIGRKGCWQRIFNNYSPRFWDIGSQSPDHLIGRIIKEIDAINSAAYTAYQMGGDTIEIDSMYTIDRSVFLFTNNTYLGTGDSCGFIRQDPPITILTDTAKFNDRQIKVKSNIGFRTHQKINIANAENYDSIAGFASYTASVSPSIGGDSIIFVSGLKIQKKMFPGDSVSLFFQ